MNHFHYQNQQLMCEQVSLDAIAKQYGTPAYVYSRAAFTQHYGEYRDALGDHPGMICYAVKANSNIAVLNVLAKLGAGFDIVSIGELERVIQAGGDPKRIVFSGVAKTADEMRRALELGVYCFNVESQSLTGRRRVDGCTSADLVTSQPRCRCRNASLYFYRIKRK